MQKVSVPLTERWGELEKLFESDSPMIRRHKERLFGPDSGIKTGGLFNEIRLCKRDGMPQYHEFKQLPLNDRAKYIAFGTLDSMKELIERHDSILEENKRKAISKSKKGR